MNISCFKNKYGTLTVASVRLFLQRIFPNKFNWVWISRPKHSTQICHTDLMCLLKLNHHDLTSKIHTVKSYKVTQAEDEIKRSKCTLCVRLHDLCSLSGACAVVFQLCPFDTVTSLQHTSLILDINVMVN